MDKRSIYHQRFYAEQYDEDRFGGSFGHFLHDIEIETFLSLMDSSYNYVLDVGAGTGKLSIPLSLQYENVLALDFSPEMIKVAIINAKKRGIELKTIVCDSQRLCFNDKTFDCVVSSRMLMHLTDWRKGIAELCRVSKTVVILDFPPLLGFSVIDSLFKRFIKRFISHTQTYKIFMVNSIAEEFQKNHFKVVLKKRQFFLPYSFHRYLNLPWLSEGTEKFFRIIGLIRLMGAPVTVKAVRSVY
ncbi:MAG: class I SAM-dependent methyltransferase [Thermodesulfobacteriota bacterium]